MKGCLPPWWGLHPTWPFRYVLNLKAFRMKSRISHEWFSYVATCYVYVLCLLVTAWPMRSWGYGSIRDVCMTIRLLPSIVAGYTRMCTTGLGSSSNYWTIKQHSGVQNVKLLLRLRLGQDVWGRKETPTPINFSTSDGKLLPRGGYWHRRVLASMWRGRILHHF